MKDRFAIMGSYFPGRTGESIIRLIINKIVDGKEVGIDVSGLLSQVDVAGNLLSFNEFQINSDTASLSIPRRIP